MDISWIMSSLRGLARLAQEMPAAARGFHSSAASHGGGEVRTQVELPASPSSRLNAFMSSNVFFAVQYAYMHAKQFNFPAVRIFVS